MAASAVAYVGVRETYGTGTYTRNEPLPEGIQPGDVVLLAVTVAGVNVTVDTTGWVVIQPMMLFGTRSWAVLAKVYTTGTTIPLTFTTTGGGGMTVGLVALRDVNLEQVSAASTWQRNTDGNGGSDNRTIGMSQAHSSSGLVVAMHGEATTALESNNPYATIVGGVILGVQDFQAGVSSNIEKVLASYSSVSGSGNSPDQVVTWQNTAQNGVATSVFFPEVSHISDKGNILHASATQVAPGVLRVSARVLKPESDVRVVRGSESYQLNVSSIGYGWVDVSNLEDGTHGFSFSVDGVPQTDWSGEYDVSSSSKPKSFVFVTGSCQRTGSNHPIFERMMEDNPLFFAHQGDLHYENALEEAAWLSGINQSMQTPRMRDLLANTQFYWQWDNHDRWMVDTLNLGTTDPRMIPRWREYAGTDGWPFADNNARTWVVGRVRFIQTDPWTVRDDPDLVPEPRSFLGAAQTQWFKDVLSAAEEPVIVWFTQWTAQNNANGRWNSFMAATADLESWINARPGIKARLKLIGGDSHSLQADSGTRASSHRFVGIPSLNISGFNQASNTVAGTISPPWDIACRTLQDDPLTEDQYKYGGYSRVTIEDDGASVLFKWEGVRVDDQGNSVVLASYEHRVGTIEIDGKTCTLWGHNGTRSVPLSLEVK